LKHKFNLQRELAICNYSKMVFKYSLITVCIADRNMGDVFLLSTVRCVEGSSRQSLQPFILRTSPRC